MSEAVPQAAASMLVVVLAWAAVAKMARADRWRANLRNLHLGFALRALSFLVVPWAELVAALLVVAGARRSGAALTLAMMVVFSMVTVRARILQHDNKLGCGCFGGSSRHDYRILLLRNIALGAVAAYVWASATSNPSASEWPYGLTVAFGGLTAATLMWALWQMRSYVHRQQHHRYRRTADSSVDLPTSS